MLTGSQIFLTLVILLGAAGVYMLLPHSHGNVKTRTAYIIGGVLSSLALIGFLSLLSPPADLLEELFFYVFSAVSLGAAVMTITSRNPIYSALWFAAVVLATSGLFVLAGAQFLAAGTVIVYAGAIIVTFLFVIMLAQMEGKTLYDRSARSPGLTVSTGFLLLWALLFCLLEPGFAPVGAYTRDDFALREAQTLLTPGRRIGESFPTKHPTRTAIEHAFRPTSSIFTATNQEKPDVAGLGEALYADHLLTVELAGALLFAALVAAIAMTNPRRPIRPGDPEPADPRF